MYIFKKNRDVFFQIKNTIGINDWLTALVSSNLKWTRRFTLSEEKPARSLIKNCNKGGTAAAIPVLAICIPRTPCR